jgi:hypothetical protein
MEFDAGNRFEIVDQSIADFMEFPDLVEIVIQDFRPFF